jgi:pyridoxal phosphate enzyme (YggS family)
MYEARLRENLPRVEARIAAAQERSGRSAPVTLVAVTKTHPPAAVRAALAVGLRSIGENRVQELEAKVTEVGRDSADWHLIGHLQRNKVRRALALFDLIESVDSYPLAQELSAEAERAGREVEALVELNVSGEASKSGFSPDEGLDAVAAVAALPHLRVRGLMTIGPLTDDAAAIRAAFVRMRRLYDDCARDVPGFEARWLSMGMSGDFEVALEEGSTLIRLGTVLFGERLT